MAPAAADPVEVAALAYLARPGRLARAGRGRRRGGPRRGRQRRHRRTRSARPSSGPPAPSTTGRWPGWRPTSCATSWPGSARSWASSARRRAAPARRCARRRPRRNEPASCWPPRRAAPPRLNTDHDAEVRRLRTQAGRGRGGRRHRQAERQGRPGGRRRPALAAAGDDRAGRLRAAPGAGPGPGRQAAGRLRRRRRGRPARRAPSGPGPAPRTPTTRPGSTSCSPCPGRT